MGGTYLTQDDFIDPLLVKGRQLLEEDRYEEAEALLRSFQTLHPENAEGAFLLGFALAKQEKWDIASDQFEQAISLQPGYVSAFIELAGVQFKLGYHDKAIDLFQKALDLDSDNSYAAEFLANLLYLEDRKIEALEYWNNIEKPKIKNITYRTAVDVEPKLLQQIFPLNEGEVLRRKQILDIRWKQEQFDLDPKFFWHITTSSNDEWDLEIGLPPRGTLSPLKTILLSNAVRVPVYREAVIEYPLELRSGKKFKGIVRWDSPQKRLSATAWFPFLLSKSDGLGSTFDWRNEAWVTGQTGIGFRYKTKTVKTNYDFLMRNRMAISFHAGYDHQVLSFKEIQPQEMARDFPNNQHFLNLGLEWKKRIGLSVSDKVKVDWKVYYNNHFGLDGKRTQARQVAASTALDWQLDPSRRFELKASLGAGHSSQNIPLSKYFVLGVGQDNPLPLRAHPTVVDEHKGNSPLGRQFILGNLELHRRLIRWRVLEIKGQIFMDIGTVYETPFGNESGVWYRDIGCGLRFGALGSDLIEILFGYDINNKSTNFWIGLPN